LLGVGLLSADTTSQGYPILKAEAGETCTVCGTSLTDDDVALIVRGRRVPLGRAMVDEFLANEERYFATLQPQGALFQEADDSSGHTALGGVNLGWFLAGFYVLTAVLFAGLSGYTAVSKGLKPLPHFLIGLAFSALGYLYVLTRPPQEQIPSGLSKVHSTSDPVACGKCGYANHPSSKKCASCGAVLSPSTVSEVGRVEM